jgi:hypothetical protein
MSKHMSEQELQKWESKLKFWMVMNDISTRDLYTLSVKYCNKCINGAFNRECPSTRIQWSIQNKKIELIEDITFSECANFICMEWVKHV